ncbi:MAG: hypothetical protein GKC53_03055 [Neisseriaceae bacterium]|nr:MAG: hypothetical protein GKC53_03055 [Neisseriaceae bacterium]
MKYNIVDTRPYSENKNKNELLWYVEQIINSQCQLSQKMAQQSLQKSITQMLKNHHYLSLSVALSLAPSRKHYQILFNQLDDILMAQENENQFIVMPLVMVLGNKDKKTISLEIPLTHFQDILQDIYGRIIRKINWLDSIILADNISQIKADEWYDAKYNPDNLLKNLQNKISSIVLEVTYEVKLGFIFGYGSWEIKKLINLRKNTMPIMQFWNKYFLEKGTTPFVNPLPINSPLQGLTEGSYVQKKMDLDIFVTNTIRNIKLMGHRIAVVIATKKGGMLEIRIQALEDNKKFVDYHWQLTSCDQIDEIIGDLIILLRACLVDNVRILEQPLELDDGLPNYHTSLEEQGINPLVL